MITFKTGVTYVKGLTYLVDNRFTGGWGVAAVDVMAAAMPPPPLRYRRRIPCRSASARAGMIPTQDHRACIVHPQLVLHAAVPLVQPHN